MVVIIILPLFVVFTSITFVDINGIVIVIFSLFVFMTVCTVTGVIIIVTFFGVFNIVAPTFYVFGMFGSSVVAMYYWVCSAFGAGVGDVVFTKVVAKMTIILNLVNWVVTTTSIDVIVVNVLITHCVSST